MIETARRFLIDAMVKYGYEGFSEDIDRTYDSKAAFFVVTDKDNNLIATARMVSRVEGENLPFEDGRRPDGSNYSTTTDHFRWSEINSFAYKKGQAKALPVLFAALGRYAWLSGITRVACLLDKNNNKTASLYSRAGFCLSKRFTDEIYFPTFGRTKNGRFEPTNWAIMTMNLSYIFFHSLRASQFDVISQ
jgi:hypothetical protein